jgi:site-specific recombinase XerD
LRHTGATWAAADGVDMRQLAGMMGHSQQRTTELYAKHHPSFMRDVTHSLDATLASVL